jgi:putative PIN family toxin of toxin-antitoxin system
MPSGARAAPDRGMISAVFDANLLVSAFLSRNNPGGVSNELLRFVIAGAIELHLSIEIVDEVVEVLLRSERAQATYRYSADQVGQYRADLMTLATIIDDPSPTPGAVPRDPDDDKIVACAVAAAVQYIISRDDHLLSLQSYAGILITTPEEFIHIVRRHHGRLPDTGS